MTNREIGEVLHRARSYSNRHGDESQYDSRLLLCYLEEASEDAFTALVARHGPMVMSVCRRLLQQVQDAEDAFQATFLLLACKASSLQNHVCLRGWLYESAYRTASKLRTSRLRRQHHETKASETVPTEVFDDPTGPEVREILDEELTRLPAHYRLPLWLCYWEGHVQSEAARKLGWSEGQLRGKLHRGRERLRQQLVKRGLSLATVLPMALLEPSAQAASAELVRRTAQTACVLLDRSVESAVSQQVFHLLEGELTMKGTTLAKCLLVGVLMTSVLATVGFGQLTEGTQPTVEPKKFVRQEQPRTGEEAPASEVAVQDEKWTDLIERIDPEKHTVGQGIWRLRKGQIVAYPAHGGARLRIPLVPQGAYEIRAKWEPTKEGASLFFLLPHGEQVASIELDDRIQYSGLGDLNGVRGDINETSKKLDVKPGQVYQVKARITWTEKQIYVEAELDGKKFLDWEGKRSEVHHEYYAPPKPYSLGLAVGGQPSVIHSLELRMIQGEAQPWKPAKKKAPTRM